MTEEQRRLDESRSGRSDWKRWGPYVSERAWGTVREDYSPDGNAWEYFPHDHARSRAYRWSEDGLAGICDRHQLICFCVALWNGRDPILKERLFGLTTNEGRHGEDVKEYYFYLDCTPTHSYMKYLYKYPQAPFPYDNLVQTNRSRSRNEFASLNRSIPAAHLFPSQGSNSWRNRRQNCRRVSLDDGESIGRYLNSARLGSFKIVAVRFNDGAQ